MSSQNGLLPLFLIFAFGTGCSSKSTQLNLPVELPADESTDNNTSPEEEFSCPTKPQVTGSIRTKDNSYSLDLSRLDVKASMKHKIDIDAFEDRCVNSVTITVQEAPGCVLELDLIADGGSKTMALAGARFTADSYCKNWPDKLEGSYSLASKSRFNVTPILIGERTSSQSCSNHDVQGVFQLARLSKERSVLDISLRAQGLFPSTGDTDNTYVCPGVVEPISTRIEALLGGGFVYMPGAGDYSTSPWNYPNPRLGLLDLGFRVGKTWFLGLRPNIYFESDMLNSQTRSFGSYRINLELGYRYNLSSKFQLPVYAGIGLRTLKYFNLDIGSRDDTDLSLSIGIQPSYKIATVGDWDIYGYQSTEFLISPTGNPYFSIPNYQLAFGISFSRDAYIESGTPE